jgi:hypothetical protein
LTNSEQKYTTETQRTQVAQRNLRTRTFEAKPITQELAQSDAWTLIVIVKRWLESAVNLFLFQEITVTLKVRKLMQKAQVLP